MARENSRFARVSKCDPLRVVITLMRECLRQSPTDVSARRFHATGKGSRELPDRLFVRSSKSFYYFLVFDTSARGGGRVSKRRVNQLVFSLRRLTWRRRERVYNSERGGVGAPVYH